MAEWIEKTQEMAFDYLIGFGFEEAQVLPLLEQSRKDLEKEYAKFLSLIEIRPCSVEELNNVLHALKGLLFHLGNHSLAEKLDEMRGEGIEERCTELRQLLV